MKTRTVAIIDYGAGNLRSVRSALQHLGYDPVVVASADAAINARAMILPGVGAAADTMQNLTRSGLAALIKDWIAAGRPFLGICMGMQILFEYSEEGHGQDCLGIFQGRVVRLPDTQKVPHMGWNQVQYRSGFELFKGIPNNTSFYFVHSYVVQPSADDAVAATTEYGSPFCSVFKRGVVTATQFHPEKSGAVGLRLYDNFLSSAADEPKQQEVIT